MSMVTVHGPNTMYTGTPGTPGGAGDPIQSTPAGATATQRTTNGLVFDFNFPNPGTNPASDFNWSFTGPGNPVAQAAKYSGTVTFTGPGAGTIVCTVAGATPPPANQAYTVTVAPVSGLPQMMQADGGDGGDEGASPEAADVQTASPSVGNGGGAPAVVEEEYDPYDFTVHEVMEEAHSSTDRAYIQELIAAEEAGKNRVTLVSQLQDYLATLE